MELQKLLSDNLDIKYQLVSYDFKRFFEKYIKNDLYDLIIGLGDSYGNFNKIKIETQAKNVYGNESIYPFSPIFLDLNIPLIDYYDSHVFAVSSNMGTYNCNWIAYSTQLSLNQKHLETKHLFLHLPPKASAAVLAREIRSFFENNKVLKSSNE